MLLEHPSDLKPFCLIGRAGSIPALRLASRLALRVRPERVFLRRTHRASGTNGQRIKGLISSIIFPHAHQGKTIC